ncbi:OmpA family protein [Arthrospiribacter ruber]|uniref:OmpA family protein n=1 Tax=Arthrospiribacter ruber TaxID=2487934 RepID=A0A951IVQ4_9BACT|nr:OmpA family protein [Arthrospiribacter ruber]MBW3468125.1 OmpA family protein [Arthrospiribacter ruber]
MIELKSSKVLKASGVFLLAFCFYSSLYAQMVSPVQGINSPYDEHHPVISPEGDLYFSVGFHPDNKGGATDYGDIWKSTRDKNGNWSKPQRIPGLSTTGNDVVVGFPDALSVLVYHEGNERGQGVHQYSKFGRDWNYLRKLDISNFRNTSKHFSGRLSEDGGVIVMSINSFGSFGNEDLYVSFKEAENVWTSPLNLGETINSYRQEQTPFISSDQRILYFSTNSEEKGRGKDIFFSERLDDSWTSWTAPKAIKYANTSGTEMGYTLLSKDDGIAIFTSTQNSEGFGDLMMVQFDAVVPAFELAENNVEDLVSEEEIPLSELSQVDEVLSESIDQQEDLLQVIESDSVQADDQIDIIIEDEKTPVINQSEEIKVLSSRDKSQLEYRIYLSNNRGEKLEFENQSKLNEAMDMGQFEAVFITASGHLPRDLSLDQWRNLPEGEVLLQPAVAGTAIVLENIQFNRGTSDFADAKSIQVLDQLVTFLKENETLKIRLEGHTDNAGDPVLNKDLSLKRASKIRGYLTLNGIQFERIRISGWGGTRPVADNNTEEGRDLNRRVELLIEG